ncbi:hypothetical protein, partial [Polymorphobacter multimanifer]|uniref:hypothetical protein n=1 Tax=Polymorphobacter multimanifer TaxID=1070431 RepID=UPI001A9C69E5
RDKPNQWPGFTPPSSTRRRRSNGLVCHRRAHHREIGQIVGIGESAVGTRIDRIKQKLRKELA